MIEYDFEKILCVSANTKKEDLKEVFNAFVEKWQPAQAIESDLHQFVAEANQVSTLLSQRIAKEDKVLFPMLGLMPSRT